MNEKLRKAAFRLFTVIILVVSPILFPVLLLWSDQCVRWVDLRDLYAWTWTKLVRGYP